MELPWTPRSSSFGQNECLAFSSVIRNEISVEIVSISSLSRECPVLGRTPISQPAGHFSINELCSLRNEKFPALAFVLFMRPKINYFVAFQNFRKFFRSSGCFCITHCDATLSSKVILAPLSTKDLSGGAAVEELPSLQLIEMSLLVAEIFVLKLIFSLILLRICCCFFLLLFPPLGEKEWLLTPTQYSCILKLRCFSFLVPRECWP